MFTLFGFEDDAVDFCRQCQDKYWGVTFSHDPNIQKTEGKCKADEHGLVVERSVTFHIEYLALI